MNLTFLYSGALFALPLAATPVIIHLLSRRRSPVVKFSTIRFIRASVQQTASRKRLQKWLLLACRVLLLAILIAAAAQPARLLGGSWSGTNGSTIAAVVVDTSYSMQIEQQQEPILARADAAARELLATQLAGARAALFTSQPPPADQPERLVESSALLAQWTPLAPQPSPRPLVDRIASAVDLLEREHAQDKWLVVISDFQKREFTSPLPMPKGGHVVLIDLHPDDPRSAGITRVAIDPQQPTPGSSSEAVVDVAGKPNTSRPVNVSVNTLAGARLLESGVQVATLDGAGHARLRFPIQLPAQPWLLLRAAFSDADDMPWDDARTQLLQTPPKQVVTFLGARPAPDSPAFTAWLALDPSEGTRPDAWSLTVKAQNDIAPDANVAVLLAEDWPDEARASRLAEFVRGGGTLILFLRPGLEQTWDALSRSRRLALEQLLPSDPVKQETAPVSSVAEAAEGDALLSGFDRDKFNDMIVRRGVPFSSDVQGTLLLNCFPKEPRPGQRPFGLAYRRAVGAGTAYTFATLPDRQYTNLPFHPLFLPILVRMCQRPPELSTAQNIELGQPMATSARQFDKFANLTVQGPRNDLTVVPAARADGTARFSLGPAGSPGVYLWMAPGSNDPVAITNVQLPAAESELFYTPAAMTADAGDNVIVVRSAQELKTRLARLDQPQPRWAMPITLVLLLLCAEALMGSLSRVWKPLSLRAFVPTLARPTIG